VESFDGFSIASRTARLHLRLLLLPLLRPARS
jgi:hypothetical protein